MEQIVESDEGRGRGKIDRRGFLSGVSMASVGLNVAGCLSALSPSGRFDDNLSVLISDVHVGGANEALSYTQARLTSIIDRILDMQPLPRRIICFGDLAMSFGLPVDYSVSRPMLKRLTDIGMELHITLGNHDRRSAFFAEWPGYAENQLVQGLCTHVIDLGSCDLALLDTLKGADGRAMNDMGPVEGILEGEQLSWFESFVKKARRPFFAGSHQYRDLMCEKKPLGILAESRYSVGWIYGHDHSWCPDIGVGSWQEHKIYPTLALPSTGLWGDIGFVLFRTDANGATAELVQDDFYFQTPSAHVVRPAFWDCRLRDNLGKSMRFEFERG